MPHFFLKWPVQIQSDGRIDTGIDLLCAFCHLDMYAGSETITMF